MGGLREKQKADRAERILASAVTRFREAGYRDVHMEDLAEAAEVSVGTLYNYHRTKGDLLVAVVALEVEEVLVAGERIVEAPPSGAGAALEALTMEYYGHSLSYLTKEMWRRAMALAIEAPGTRSGARYAALDAALSAQVVRMVRALQARGEIDASHDAEVAGAIVFNNLNQEFSDFVKEDAMTLDALRARARAQARLLAAALAPR